MSGLVFAAPPGWPTFPPGMVPPASWVPPAQLPPPPPGWVFYRGASGEPLPTPPGAWHPLPLAALTPPAVAMPSDPQQAPPPVQPLLPSAPPPPPRRRRLLGLWVALGVILVVGVVIVGLLAYTRSLVPPVISAAQAARLTEQTTFGSRSVDWVRSEVNLGEPPELPGCQEWYVIVKAKTTASFVATNEPDLQVYVFDTSATAENMVAQWFICDFAGGSSKSRMDDTARTEGVLWVANSERAFLAYSNVVVIAPLDTDDLNASIVATKTLVNSLR